MGNDRDGGLAGESQATAQPLLSLKGIVKTYASGEGEVRVLDGVDLELAAGEFIEIKGFGGVGNSTRLYVAAEWHGTAACCRSR